MTPCTDTLTPLTLKVYALVRMEHRDQEFLGVCATCLHLSSSELQVSNHFLGLSWFIRILLLYVYIYTQYTLYIHCISFYSHAVMVNVLPGLLLRGKCGGIDDGGDSEHSVPRSFPQPAATSYGVPPTVGGQRLQLKRLHMGIQH